MGAIFRVSNLLFLPFWALMILFPRRHWATRIMRSPLVNIAPAALYAVLVLPRLSTIWPAVSRPTLASVATLLGSPAGATIAWVHFLAFDLFVGRWIYLESNERQISVWLIAPVLFLTLMLGPFGFLLYLAVRSATSFTSGNSSVVSNLEVKESTKQSLRVSGARMSWRLAQSLLRSLGTAFEINRALTIMGSAMLLVLLATVVGLFVDHRVITGVPAWLKPAKFAISVSVYCFTFVWLLGFIENHPRLVRFTANVTVISFIVEMVVIITQAARGTTSHFNMTSPINSFLWMSMGLFITFVWAMNLLLAFMLVQQRIPDRTFAWSLRLAVIISSIGMAVAFLMAKPTPAQVASGGHGAHIIGAHSVGVADGGPGLPVLGWSTVGGDLRAAHFVGLHALQVLPLLGWISTRRKGNTSFLHDGHRLALIWTAGFSYLGLVLLLTWQAWRGQSVIQLDEKTINAAIALASVAALSTLVTLVHAFSRDGRVRGVAPQATTAKDATAIRAQGMK